MKEVIGIERENILKKYPELGMEKLYWDRASEFYKGYNISIFNHYLSEEEAENEILFYSDDLSSKKLEKYLKREKKLLKSLMNLNNKEVLFALKYNEDDSESDTKNIKVFKFSSSIEFEKEVTLGLREKKEFNVVIPVYESILISDYDLELVLFSNNEEGARKLFDDYFLERGLYLLTHGNR